MLKVPRVANSGGHARHQAPGAHPAALFWNRPPVRSSRACRRRTRCSQGARLCVPLNRPLSARPVVRKFRRASTHSARSTCRPDRLSADPRRRRLWCHS
jgi:hypothetical protein